MKQKVLLFSWLIACLLSCRSDVHPDLDADINEVLAAASSSTNPTESIRNLTALTEILHDSLGRMELQLLALRTNEIEMDAELAEREAELARAIGDLEAERESLRQLQRQLIYASPGRNNIDSIRRVADQRLYQYQNLLAKVDFDSLQYTLLEKEYETDLERQRRKVDSLETLLVGEKGRTADLEADLLTERNAYHQLQQDYQTVLDEKRQLNEQLSDVAPVRTSQFNIEPVADRRSGNIRMKDGAYRGKHIGELKVSLQLDRNIDDNQPYELYLVYRSVDDIHHPDGRPKYTEIKGERIRYTEKLTLSEARQFYSFTFRPPSFQTGTHRIQLFEASSLTPTMERNFRVW